MSALAVTRLSVSHFRSHRRSALDTDGRSVALFGPNGAGKTNLLEAVSILSPGRGLRRASAEDMTRRPEALGWKVTAGLDVAGRPHEIETGSEAGAARSVRIDGKAAPQTALAGLLRVLWLVPAMDRLWIEGAEGRRRFLDRATLSFCPDHGEAVLTYEKAMRERNRLLKDQVRDSHWYAALEAQMADAGARVHANRVEAVRALIAAQDGAETAFPRADLTLGQAEGPPVGTVEEAVALLAEGRMRDMAAGRTLSGPHRSDLLAVFAAKGVAARDCSTGEQKALLLSLILANARALKSRIGTAPVLLLDEVAAHLDASRRGALYAEIDALGAQAWMTGTGPELFEELDDAVCAEVVEADGVSVLRLP